MEVVLHPGSDQLLYISDLYLGFSLTSLPMQYSKKLRRKTSRATSRQRRPRSGRLGVRDTEVGLGERMNENVPTGCANPVWHAFAYVLTLFYAFTQSRRKTAVDHLP